MSIYRAVGGFALGLAALCSAPADALLSVSTHPTVRVSCSAGICTATAASANLNVTDLQNMLTASDVTLKPGSVASDILVNAPVTWTSTRTLTLDSWRGVTVNHPMIVEGPGGLVMTTNDGGTGGELQFTGMARVEFWDLSSPLTINGNAYTLENNIAGLASAIVANPSGNFALAKGYNARGDGSYAESPIATTFRGHFEGLGNTISNLLAQPRGYHANLGLFSIVASGGTIHDLHLVNIRLLPSHVDYTGTLAGINQGEVSYVTATGLVKTLPSRETGGLLGANDGTVRRVQATVTLPGGGGGLISSNTGSLSQSFAAPTIPAVNGSAGLLTLGNNGSIVDCYAVGSASAGGNSSSLAGLSGVTGPIANSYVAGTLTDLGLHLKGDIALFKDHGSMSNVYWDTTTTNLGQACEPGIYDCPEAVGLSDAQLKSGLPPGFDPTIWGENPAINNGLPYLLNNPPR